MLVFWLSIPHIQMNIHGLLVEKNKKSRVDASISAAMATEAAAEVSEVSEAAEVMEAAGAAEGRRSRRSRRQELDLRPNRPPAATTTTTAATPAEEIPRHTQTLGGRPTNGPDANSGLATGWNSYTT